ncbi:unnamed protein product [Discula destructiva]
MSSPTRTALILRLAQIASISLSLLCSGIALSGSVLLIPRLLESPVPLMLRQWRATFQAGKRFFQLTTMSAASVFLLLSWQHRRGSFTADATPAPTAAAAAVVWKLYLAAGLLCSSVGPFTVVAVNPTNRELLRRAEEEEMREVEVAMVDDEHEEEEEHQLPLLLDSRHISAQQAQRDKWLVDHWGVLNLPRGFALGLAGVLGLAAAL